MCITINKSVGESVGHVFNVTYCSKSIRENQRVMKQEIVHPRILYRHHWLTLCAGYLDEPFIHSTDGVLIVPLNASGEILFINEPAITDGRPVLGLPGGAVDEGESPALAANRELQEEIGYQSLQLDLLHEFHPLARHAQWRLFTYLARNLRVSKLAGDEPYEMVIEKIPLANFEPLIEAGRLNDSTVIAALYLTRSFLDKEQRATLKGEKQ
jgi:ADP-ribose diphosphatase